MKLFLRSILFLAIIAAAPRVIAQPDWRNQGSNTSWDTNTNWINGDGTMTVPGPGDSVHIFPGFIATPDVPNLDILISPGGTNHIVITTQNNQSIFEMLVSGNFAGIDGAGNGSLDLSFTNGATLNLDSGGMVITGSSTLNFTGHISMVNGGNFQVGTFVSSIDTGLVTGSGTLTLATGSSINMDSFNPSFYSIAADENGTVIQNGNSSVTTGQQMSVGQGTGTGTYILNDGSTLNLGAQGGAGIAGSYTMVVGDTGPGTVTLNSNSSLNASNDFTDIEIGAGAGATGMIFQANNSVVSITGNNSDLLIGVGNGTGSYILQGGTLTVGAGVTVSIGDSGTGLFQMDSGTADFQGGFDVGGTGNGTFTQVGGTLTAETNAVTVGVNGGTGLFQMGGGNATLSQGMAVGANGTVLQTGGVLNLSGGTLDLSAIGGTFTLAGGTLQLATGGLVGTSGQGHMNFAGGTLQVSNAGAFTSGLDGTVTGNSTIDALTTPGVTNVTMSGNLTGSGGLSFEGGAGTVFLLSGTNGYTGATSIVSGTLDASVASIGNSSAWIVGPTSTLELTLAPGGFAYGGVLQGSGAFNVNFANTGDALVLANTKGYSGSVLLGANGTGGTLQVYQGSFSDVSDNGTNSAVVIGGTELLPFPQGTAPTSGTVNFGTTSYTGLTTINTGFTLNANALAGAVQNNGSLFALESADLTNNGVLGLNQGSAVGSTFNINGGLTSNAGSTIAIRVNAVGATTVADAIVASGAANIDSTTAIKLTGSGNITTPIAIITGNGGLTVAPGALPILKSGLLLTGVLDINGNSIELTTTQNSLVSFANTPNQAAAGGALDTALANSANLTPGQQAALNKILSAFNNFPAAPQISKALEQLTPESLQYSRIIAFENTSFLVQKMNGVDADLRAGYGGLDTNAISVTSPAMSSSLGRSMNSLFASTPYHQAAPNGVNYYPGGGSTDSPDPNSASGVISAPWNSSSQVITDTPNPYLARQHPDGPDAPAISEFIAGDAILADLNQNQSQSNAPSSSASYTAASATAGVSFRITPHLAVGAFLDYNHTDARTDDQGSKTKVDSYSPGLFATYFDHGFYANGLFSFGYNNYNNTRNIGLLGESASSNPDGQQYVGSLDVGYDFHPDKHWVVGPTLGATYTHLDVDSFTESGAPGANLAVDSQSADSFRTRLGGHAIYQLDTGNILLQPNLTLAWQHEWLNDSDGITSSFEDISPAKFTINTAGPVRDSALVGCGLTATLNTSLTLYLNYFADVGFNDQFAQSIIGGFKTRF